MSTIALRFGNASITFVELEIAHRCHFRLNRYYTLASYKRLFLTELLDSIIEKVLYVDCDIIIWDIGDHLQTELNSAFLATTPDLYILTAHRGFGPDDICINSGVMLIDAARWRAANILPVLVQFAEDNSSDLDFRDQGVLNQVFRGKIRFPEYPWNLQNCFTDFPAEALNMGARAFQKVRRLPPTVHFTTKYKPWICAYEPHYKRLYHEARVLIPWKDCDPPDPTPKAIPLKFLKVKHLKACLKWYAPRRGNFLISSRQTRPE